MATAGMILGLSSGFKFEPSDDELVELFLLPRLRGQPLPLDGVVIDDDPWSAPPWKLFARNGRNSVDSAYFFAPAGDSTKNRQGRGCVGGGTWVGQKLEAREELRLGDGEIMVWQKYRLNFHWGSGRSGSTGWVMLEYTVVVPDSVSFKICHITFTGHGQKRKRVPDGYVDSEIAAPGLAASAATPPSATTWYQGSGAAHASLQEHFLEPPYAYNQVYSDATVHGGETDQPWAYQEPFATQQFVDQELAPLVDLASFSSPGFPSTAPAMDHGTMPLPMDQETGTTEHFVEYGTMTLPMDQETGMTEQLPDVDDPVLRAVLESLGDFATAAQADAQFGEYWANAGQDYGGTPVV